MLLKKTFVMPVIVLLFFSLISTASTALTRAVAQSSGPEQQLTVYIHSLQPDGNKVILTADEINWYEGQDADRVFAQREPEAAQEIGGAPDGYYIENDSDTLTEYPLADDVDIKTQIFDHTGTPGDLDIIWNESVDLDTFLNKFHNTDVVDLSQFPYHITVQDGKVTAIVQQYIP
ncbi:hypothetical protein SAMN04487895_10561 [Paenibacillus sophorae]|uniref:Uncharacterized protein n=1 Tax=Paenibacillus sophorae TaxID=1333845 RepID=A0A1H8M3U2_9BACL|nr:hypothetical protein [Paenibacillus sophorae]QWU17663.1 hypothetical protein KP014_11290 [Paenibacillus sophorae]SEO12052.1 hypothetical protein SAMN04487895_10561 [Paenibacillus sophorae]